MTAYPKEAILATFRRAAALRKYSHERCIEIAAEALALDVDTVRQVIDELAEAGTNSST